MKILETNQYEFVQMSNEETIFSFLIKRREVQVHFSSKSFLIKLEEDC
jgi:hypothetical protein